ncbi:MAG: hypothetical protein WCS84_10480 [Nocardioides sp.]
MPDRPTTATTRRTALGVVLGGLVGVSACDAVDLDPRSEPAASGSPTEPPADADTVLVEQVVADLVAMLAPAATSRARDVRRVEASFFALHVAHLGALDAPEPEGPAPQATLSRADGLRSLRRRERQHQRRLEDACLAATSGALARLFASMSAAVAQRLAVLPEERP